MKPLIKNMKTFIIQGNWSADGWALTTAKSFNMDKVAFTKAALVLYIKNMKMGLCKVE